MAALAATAALAIAEAKLSVLALKELNNLILVLQFAAWTSCPPSELSRRTGALNGRDSVFLLNNKYSNSECVVS